MNTLRKLTGSRIRQYRKTKGYSIEELAHQAGMNSAHVAKIERGVLNFTVGSLDKILSALEIPYSVFLQFDESIAQVQDPLVEKTKAYMKNMSLEDQQYVYNTAKFLYQKRDHNE